MSSSTLNEPSVPKDTLLLVGPVFLGAVTSWLIFGISIVQLYIYHISFPNDRKGIQFLVYWVFILDIFLTVIAGAMGWHVLCAGWGRQTNLIQPGWTFSAIGAGDGIIATTVQLFYAWRIWVLKKWRVIPGLIIVISLAQLGSTLSIAAGIANLQDISGLLPYFPRTTIWLGGGALADIFIAISMVYVLTTAKKNSHALKSSDRAINRLIRLSVETGIITAASAIIELGFFLGPTTKNTNLHLFFALILGKIYSNTMFTSLNSRLGTQQATTSRAPTDVTSVSITGTHNFRGGSTSVRTGPAPPVVHIASHTEVFADDVYSSDRDDKQTLNDDLEMMERKPRSDIHLQSFSPV
ncbi:hypothetical protein BD309DRAFT_1016901 [Dichomitus squalens]|uniref:DUF6534 domain-containing protein n=2 Tax=Dichomitus squalens TaxID=114155 RepID=A0A4Q9NZV0_9APHY|nr:uncharacterized protein DICSQDRAFT_138247 [Dichomitus squalens LYAD-421 SS1]EJF59788.1 hypothetical protein DICSQDRAFT_138247 [Dichomitus squalens LYAD-421 SS1]TBU34307.1 hypothetical protein BD311DRAFT_747512 [Dichomitus squalens]TBU46725.1 hypothetical protein BD309DRAFT_1016901 [Dichomitus squalens]TBU57483.1 hypothetical protein BD310DRAFT_929145 [Dichomitus squalens]